MGRAGFGHRVEGFHAVVAAAEQGRVQVLHVEPGRVKRPEVASLVERVERSGGRVDRVTDVRRLAETSAPQGVVAECRPIPAATLEDAAATSQPAAVMVLDRLVDPHNVGAVVRSAVAAGITGFVLSDRRAAPPRGGGGQAAAGAPGRAPGGGGGALAQAGAAPSPLGPWAV